MATGDLRRPTKAQRAKIDEAVRRAEAHTGLQICVVLGAPQGRDAHAHAEAVFIETGLTDRPAVLVLVAPAQRHVELLTVPSVRDRLDDAAASTAVDVMVEAFARGELVAGLVAGLDMIAASAGAGSPPEDQIDITNIVDTDD